MRIEEDVKLDFKDVLIRPKRSTLKSRSQVDIKREVTFKHSGQTYEGVPIIAANMDGVGTMEMAKAFIKDGNGMTVALHKHYPLETLIDFFGQHGGSSVWYSIGLVQDDRDKLKAFLESAPQKEGKGIEKICIDVANGYSTDTPSDTHERTRSKKNATSSVADSPLENCLNPNPL